jgi:hypothetical protein
MTEDSPLSGAREHRHRLFGNAAAQAQIHGTGVIGRVNQWLAVTITNAVGTMWCAYVFAALALVSLPAAIRSHDPVIVVSWLSQTFLQLVLLSIIIVGQNVQAAAGQARAEADHETLIHLHTLVNEVQKINEHQLMILQAMEKRLS